MADINYNLLKLDHKEQYKTELFIDELSDFINEQNDNQKEIKVNSIRRFGKVKINLSYAGEKFNYYDSSNYREEDEIRKAILLSFKEKVSYRYYGGQNHYIYVANENNAIKSAITIIGCMVLGIVFGLLLKTASSSVSSWIDINILGLIRDMFMNALKLCIIPLVFCSVVSSIVSMGDIQQVGKIGGRMLVIYLSTTLIASVLGTVAGYIYPQGPNSSLMNAIVDSEIAPVTFSLSEFIKNIVPKDIVSPVINGDMMQILFIAVCVGLGLCVLHSKTERASEVIIAINTVIEYLLGKLMKLMPVMAFCSMASLAASMEISVLLCVANVIVGTVIGVILMIFAYSLEILLLGRISPVPFLRKLAGVFLTPFSLASSSASIPNTLKWTTKTMGVDEKIAAFSIPLGATINMDGGGFVVAFVAVLAFKLYNLPITASMLFVVIILSFALNTAAPGVPNAALATCVTVFMSTNVPLSIMPLLIGIWPIVDTMVTAVNVVGDSAATISLASADKRLDMKTYNS